MPQHFPLCFPALLRLQKQLRILVPSLYMHLAFLFVCIPVINICDFFGPSPQVTVPFFLRTWLMKPHFTFLKLQLNIAITWPIPQLTVWLRRPSERSAPDSAAWMDPRGHCSTPQRSPATSSWPARPPQHLPGHGMDVWSSQWPARWNSPEEEYEHMESLDLEADRIRQSWCSLTSANVKGGEEGGFQELLTNFPLSTSRSHRPSMTECVDTWRIICVF